MSEGFDGTENGGGGGGGGVGKEQDRFLPIANIGRIMRRAVPENGKIAKDSKESVQECVSEFISFITSESVSPRLCICCIYRCRSLLDPIQFGAAAAHFVVHLPCRWQG